MDSHVTKRPKLTIVKTFHTPMLLTLPKEPSRLRSLMYNMEVQEICSGLNSSLMCPAKLLF
ncbi:hypothetical protein E2320_009148 [Naja naja]|nr:hypothetical protein E2320_009148 [Naja naja]